MNYLALLTVALAIAMPAVEATKCIPTIPKGAGKKTTCTALSKGGLVNLAALGCADVDISPSIDILRRNADARRSLEIVEQRSSQDFCKALSLGGLINLSLLGCTDVTVSPDIDVLRRTVSDKESICKALSLGGLINVALLGCADVDISPDVDILRKRNALCARFADNGLHARGLGCEGSHLEARAAEVDMERRWSKCSALSKAGLLNLSLLGCGDVDVSPDVDILKRGNCYNPPKTTKKHHTKTKTRTHKPTHKPTTRRPQPTTTRTRKTHQPTHTPRPQPPACAVNVKETCESMSSAGLINLDVLGCANVKVAPTIKVGQALLPAVTNIVGTVGGTVDNLVDNLVGDVLGGLLGGKRN